jgi:very-short-patch-repair endonuclease
MDGRRTLPPGPSSSPFAMQPQPDDIVLVAVMTSPRDMDIARQQGWYRIPVKHAPAEAVGAPYLAFYQTKSFGPERWAVNYYAPATSWQTVTRLDLFPQEPSHPHAVQEYYKVSLQPLIALPQPVVSKKLRRLAFIVTRWALLERASEINDLFHGNELEERLWRVLKRAGIPAERRFEVREQRQTYLLDLAVFCRQGKLGVLYQGQSAPDEPGRWMQECALVGRGWAVLRFSVEEVESNLAGCARAVEKAVQRLGGVTG